MDNLPDKQGIGRSRSVSALLSAGAALFLTLGGAYYFIAAVNWLRTGYWPNWSLRRLGVSVEPPGTSRALEWVVDGLLSASPGFLALLAAALMGTFAVLLDRQAVRRGSARR